jgi:spore germination cell wall hydrolase CwlJ-like protein
MTDDGLKAGWDRSMLALMIWREARGETMEGKIAVGFTVLNRVAHPGWWGHDVAQVIGARWQYSSMTDPRDPQLTAWPTASDALFLDCLRVADEVLAGSVDNPVPGADSYYAVSMPTPPKWADPAKFVKQIGRHLFYNLDGDPGPPPTQTA